MRLLHAVVLLALVGGCERRREPTASREGPRAGSLRVEERALTSHAKLPSKLELREQAMGTTIVFVAYTNADVSDEAGGRALGEALEEIRRLELLMTTYRSDSELSRANASAGRFFPVSPETFEVIDKSLWAGRVSEGAFDITFHTLGDLWKFGSIAEPDPRPPSPTQAARLAELVDYRLVELDEVGRRVKVPEGRAIDLGGIAKGYAVDRAASILKKHKLRDFLVQAGGDLYGAGQKPDGSPWVSGVQDPRGDKGQFFATLPLEDHAFSTAGDYARSFVHDGRRYHHIIDPRTGFPATACRSVTVWAPTAFLADAIDDAVFVLGPEKGLALVESLDGVGALIVDEHNKVWTSRRLEGKVRILRPPSDGI